MFNFGDLFLCVHAWYCFLLPTFLLDVIKKLFGHLLRLLRQTSLFDSLIQCVIGQKVTSFLSQNIDDFNYEDVESKTLPIPELGELARPT